MNAFQNNKCQDLNKPSPGCMGRMINTFSANAGMTGTKMLTGKEHYDGSSIHRNQPDVIEKTTDPITIATKRGKSSSRKKPGEKSMEILLAHEMSKELRSNQKPPGVVARLMGLDPLPDQQSLIAAQRNSKDYSHDTLQEDLQNYWQQEDGYLDDFMLCKIHSQTCDRDWKYIYAEGWQQTTKTAWMKGQTPCIGKHCENSNEKRITPVCQKFTSVEHLATAEKLFQSKGSQDALEVLSSNKDIFVKFLEQPNSLQSKHLNEVHTIPLPSQAQQITVLKPSTTVEMKGKKDMEKQLHPPRAERVCDIQKCHRDSYCTHPKAERSSPPTRIVVLKPSPGKLQNIRGPVNPGSSVILAEERDFCGGLGTDETVGSRKIAKEITHQMQKCLGREQRDEIFSVVANGYDGDASSFDQSGNEHIEEVGSNISDLEIVTPTSQHSGDHNNRFGSLYSLPSSLSGTSYSPDSSVSREAKKRLTERWAWVASNGTNQEEMQSSSTLGEVLAIPEIRKEEEGNGVQNVSSWRSCNNKQDRAQAAFLSGDSKRNGISVGNSRNLLRLKSTPVSSSAFENRSLHVEVSKTLISKLIASKKVEKTISRRSSFRGKVLSLFFTRNRKLGGVKFPSVNFDDKFHFSSTEAVGEESKSSSISVYECQPDESPLINSVKKSKGMSELSSLDNQLEQYALTAKANLPRERPKTSENFSENQDQPSPTSVLDVPFKYDINNNSSQFCDCNNVKHLQSVSRSPPIESITRTLSWDDNRSDASSPYQLRTSLLEADEEWFEFIQNLLSSSGFCNKNPSMIFTRWHSADSPLNPTLVDQFFEWNGECVRPKHRSNMRLIFDCVNEALLDIGQNALSGTYPWLGTHCRNWKGNKARAPLNAQVWGLVRDWFSGMGISCGIEDCSQMVDRMAKREVVGRGWAALMWLEISEFCKDICREVLEELVDEALANLRTV